MLFGIDLSWPNNPRRISLHNPFPITRQNTKIPNINEVLYGIHSSTENRKRNGVVILNWK